MDQLLAGSPVADWLPTALGGGSAGSWVDPMVGAAADELAPNGAAAAVCVGGPAGSDAVP